MPEIMGVLEWKRTIAYASYDICPQSRSGGEATQAMLIMGELISLPLGGPAFLLNVDEATELVGNQIKTIKQFWVEICNAAALTEVDRNFMWRRQFLNAFALIDAPQSLSELVD